MTTKRKTKTADSKKYAALIHVMACCSFSHGATPHEATWNAIRQAKSDLKGVFNFPQETEWTGNVYEVNGKDWTYDYYEGLTLEDGTPVSLAEHVKMRA
jgi:hypothetical protein